jgi:biopolymer transport protein ExbD
LPEWLRQEAARSSEPVLVVRASREVRMALLTEIASAATEAGFARVLSAAVEPQPAGGAPSIP